MTDEPQDPSAQPTHTSAADQPAGNPPPPAPPPPVASADSPTVVGMPAQTGPPTPGSATSPTEGGVGFAALGPSEPTQGYGGPPPGYPPGPPPGYPGGPGQGYGGGPPQGYGGPPQGYGGPPQGYGPGPGYYPPPPASAGGPSPIVVLIVGLVLIAVIGAGAAFALKLGPFAPSPTGTPLAQVPTLVPTRSPAASSLAPSPTPEHSLPPVSSETPTPPASVGPTRSPLVSISPSPSPGDAGAELLTHVPIAFRDTCTAIEGVAPVLATASCSQDSGEILVLYYQYATNEDMNSAYQGFVSASEIEPDSGDCKDASTWPAESSYTISSQPAGRWLCTDKPGDPTIYWTDDRLSILSQASHTVGDHVRLVDFWVNDSGPYQ